jgi:hypothetical protein
VTDLNAAMGEAIGRQLGVPTKSLSPAQAAEHFGNLAIWVTGSGKVETSWTRERLGWQPLEIGLIAVINRREYFANGENHAD